MEDLADACARPSGAPQLPANGAAGEGDEQQITKNDEKLFKREIEIYNTFAYCPLEMSHSLAVDP